jgi:hypothetical protein
MKSLLVVASACLLALSAVPANAQFGLYGSPEILNLSQTDPAVVPYQGYPTRDSYPARPSATATQPAPTGAYMAAPLPPYAGRSVRPMPSSGDGDMLAEPAATETPSLSPRWRDAGGAGAPSDAPPQTPYAADPMGNDGGGVEEGYYGQAPAADCNQCGLPADQCGCFGHAVSGFQRAVCGDCCAWYASVSVLAMTRDTPNRLWTTYQTGDDSNQLPLVTPYEWRWGGEVRLGRRFCCGCYGTWALEGTYWTLDSLDSQTSITNAAGVSTTLTVGNVFFGAFPLTQWFDDALEHRLRRFNEVQSVELSVVRYRVFSTAVLPWEVSWSLGARFFRFEEELAFSSVADPVNMTDPTMSHEAFLNDHITNDLVGFQFGFDANYYVCPTWRLFATPKFGIYNNHIEHLFQAYLGDGTVATQYEYPGLTYPVRSTTDVVSFLTQIDLGVEWQFAPRWSARVGYRVVAATGIGLADNQIPHYIVDIPEIANIDTNGDLILHGGFVGVAYNF